MMIKNYWIAMRKKEFIAGFENGRPIHTKNKERAYKFYDFDKAMTYFGDYIIIKEEEWV